MVFYFSFILCCFILFFGGIWPNFKLQTRRLQLSLTSRFILVDKYCLFSLKFDFIIPPPPFLCGLQCYKKCKDWNKMK